ncbi:hypothetical protein DFJ58DRAFT_796031 [Suillus subalutaceus]|uniref:uncharacterized protein n=1 Tax=Suillus subalutaceus TaxID=48586 RepID=UPI001B87E7CA|nr:uncharacterized protein DFJ58DRAFT_796031 [Suillus subalutaceus]KAG1848772.1 hypothetical protein DFJ58DRAFT_796031 [Suillus subalutaceus]
MTLVLACVILCIKASTCPGVTKGPGDTLSARIALLAAILTTTKQRVSLKLDRRQDGFLAYWKKKSLQKRESYRATGRVSR